MKYIKYFESHNQYYSEIKNEDEFDDIISGFIDNDTTDEDLAEYFKENRVDFTKEEIDKIQSYFDTKLEVARLGLYRFDNSSIVLEDTQDTIKFIKMKDEWYYVDIVTRIEEIPNIVKFYKCDQFSGLIKFLEDYKNGKLSLK